MLDPLPRRRAAVRQLDRILFHVQQHAVKDILACDFRFNQILIHRKNLLVPLIIHYSMVWQAGSQSRPASSFS